MDLKLGPSVLMANADPSSSPGRSISTSSSTGYLPIRAPLTIDDDDDDDDGYDYDYESDCYRTMSYTSDIEFETEGSLGGEEFETASERPFVTDSDEMDMEDNAFIDRCRILRPFVARQDEEESVGVTGYDLVVESGSEEKNHNSRQVIPIAQLSLDDEEIDGLGSTDGMVSEPESDECSIVVKVFEIDSVPGMKVMGVEGRGQESLHIQDSVTDSLSFECLGVATEAHDKPSMVSKRVFVKSNLESHNGIEHLTEEKLVVENLDGMIQPDCRSRHEAEKSLVNEFAAKFNKELEVEINGQSRELENFQNSDSDGVEKSIVLDQCWGNYWPELKDAFLRDAGSVRFMRPHTILDKEVNTEAENEANHDSGIVEKMVLPSDEDIGSLISVISDETTENIVSKIEKILPSYSPWEKKEFLNQSDVIDRQIVSDSDEEGESEGKEFVDAAPLSAPLKEATDVEPDGSGITITSPDGSRKLTLEQPASSSSSFHSTRHSPPLNIVEDAYKDNLSEEEKERVDKSHIIGVKFLRLVKRLGFSPDDLPVAEVLYKLAIASGKHSIQAFDIESAKSVAMQLEEDSAGDLDFSLNILVLGKTGVGKSATINSIFGEVKATTGTFEPATRNVEEITGTINGVKIRALDTPGLRLGIMEEKTNRRILSSIKRYMNNFPPDVVLYVDRLDVPTRDLTDLSLLRSLTSSLGSSIWHNAIVTLTHSASIIPDGPSGSPLSYGVFVSQRFHVLQQLIIQAIGNLRLMRPSMMNILSLVENHQSFQIDRTGEHVLSNGRNLRQQLLLSCYSLKILSEVNSISKHQESFDQKKFFGFRIRSPLLPYFLCTLLQSRAHPKLSSDQGGQVINSDLELGYLSNSDMKDEDEYKQLASLKSLKKSEIAKLSHEQKKAYFEEYAYRMNLLQKKSSQILVQPELDSLGWDHDCSYDGISLESSFAIAGCFPSSFALQITKDKKEFNIQFDSSNAKRHGEDGSTMAGFDIQTLGNQLTYILRAETKFKSFKVNETATGLSITSLGGNVVTGLKLENQIALGKCIVLFGNAGAVLSDGDTAYGANLEIRLKDENFPIGQEQSRLGLSLVKWGGDQALTANVRSQFSIGRSTKCAVHVRMNNKQSGQINLKVSSSEQLQIALIGILPMAISMFRSIYASSTMKRSSKY